MAFKPRLRLPRRQTVLDVEYDHQSFSVWCPRPDTSVVVADFGDAASLAATISDLGVQREALLLLDAQRRITAILVDPPGEVGLWVARVPVPGIEAGFCHSLVVSWRSQLPQSRPGEHDIEAYRALRRVHMAQGVMLLDVLLTDGDSVRSLAIASDPDPVWFDDVASEAG
jgi:hypothetical protein